jgi:hypothetical protein
VEVAETELLLETEGQDIAKGVGWRTGENLEALPTEAEAVVRPQTVRRTYYLRRGCLSTLAMLAFSK